MARQSRPMNLRSLVLLLPCALVLCGIPRVAHAEGSYRMDDNCFNSTTWDRFVQPYARPSRQSFYGCFDTPLDVVNAQCSYLLAKGDAAVCTLYAPPGPPSSDRLHPTGTNYATGGKQGETYWDVGVWWYGLCGSHSKQVRDTRDCQCDPGYEPDAREPMCVRSTPTQLTPRRR